MEILAGMPRGSKHWSYTEVSQPSHLNMRHDKHDSSQRCAMEILAGILRGSKHWSYTEVSVRHLGE